MVVSRARNAMSNREKGLERKLAAYTVASGAFLAISGVGQAQAGIYYSGPQDITIPDTAYPGSYVTFNVTTVGPLAGNTNEFTFENVDNGDGASLYVNAVDYPSGFVYDSSSGYVAALGAGTLISSASTFVSTGKMGKLLKGGTGQGDWAFAQNMYLGLTFNDPRQTYYGWAELSFPDGTGTGATLEGWAYESDPGVGIVAGAGAVPEPSTLALSLLALGSLGVAALKRSRGNQVQDHSAA